MIYIYLKYENVLYKIGGGQCWSFITGKTKKIRLNKLTCTPSRKVKNISIITAEEWDDALAEYGY